MDKEKHLLQLEQKTIARKQQQSLFPIAATGQPNSGARNCIAVSPVQVHDNRSTAGVPSFELFTPPESPRNSVFKRSRGTSTDDLEPTAKRPLLVNFLTTEVRDLKDKYEELKEELQRLIERIDCFPASRTVSGRKNYQPTTAVERKTNKMLNDLRKDPVTWRKYKDDLFNVDENEPTFGDFRMVFEGLQLLNRICRSNKSWIIESCNEVDDDIDVLRVISFEDKEGVLHKPVWYITHKVDEEGDVHYIYLYCNDVYIQKKMLQESFPNTNMAMVKIYSDDKLGITREGAKAMFLRSVKVVQTFMQINGRMRSDPPEKDD